MRTTASWSRSSSGSWARSLAGPDESWAKQDFYAAHEVDEVLIVDPESCGVTWRRRNDTGYSEADGSGLLGITAADLASQLDWPPVS
jgi:hypothetical protein